MTTSATEYLTSFGFALKSVSDPTVWMYLENQMHETDSLGGRFAMTTSSRLEEILAMAETAALQAMADQHKRGGNLGRVDTVISLPFVIGTEHVVPLDTVGEDRRLQLVLHPGATDETLVTLVPASDDDIPVTKQVTVSSGLYADGQTLGVHNVQSGGSKGQRFGGQTAYLATGKDIRNLSDALADNLDNLSVITRAEGERLLERVRKLLG